MTIGVVVVEAATAASIEATTTATTATEIKSECAASIIPSSTIILLSSSSSSFFDDLCDDLLCHIVEYCDFRSAVIFSHVTSSKLRQRLSPKNNHYNHLTISLWKQIFQRQHFSLEDIHVANNDDDEDEKDFVAPATQNNNNNEEEKENHIESSSSSSSTCDYVAKCRQRRKLLQNLFQCSKKKGKRRNCFNLPNRFYYFVPIAPNENDDLDDDDMLDFDPPPVSFDCDSFVLTSSGSSSELLLLDPFDGSLSIFADCLHNAIASDEAMMEQAMLDAASAIRYRDNSDLYKDWEEEHIAGDVIDESVYRNHNRHEYKSPPQQCLVGADDYFNIDIRQYFPTLEHLQDNDEFNVGYAGVDSKPILNDNNEIVGTMVGVGRTVTNDRRSQPLVCTEVTAWFRMHQDTEYKDQMVCRFPWSFHFVDMDPVHRRLFVSFRQDGLNLQVHSSKTVIVYPFQLNNENDDPIKYFPKPLFSIQSQHPVAAIGVDPTGKNLIIATSRGTLEFWKVEQRAATRVSVQSIQTSIRQGVDFVMDLVESQTTITTPATTTSTTNTTSTTKVVVDERNKDQIEDSSNICSNRPRRNHREDDPPIEDSREVRFAVLQRQPDIARLRENVDSFYIPRHLPVDACGFVTLQHSHEEGSSLLLWRKDCSGQDFNVASLINLPLLARRMPRVFFDGSRLVVFGADHIGYIILVYQVLSSFDEIESFQDTAVGPPGDTSGGVYNLTNPPRLRYVNRIRHAALGGIESFDSIHITCNERMLVVNTKTGNLLGEGKSPYSEGLLIIDLEDRS